MANVVKITYQLRRGYEEVWKKNNPILASGEPGFVIDKNKLKIGDGVTAWNDLEYIAGNTEDIDGDTSFLYNAETINDFPAEGALNVLYKASSERKLYQWNEKDKKYESLNDSVNVDNLTQTEGTVLILYGGSATDNI